MEMNSVWNLHLFMESNKGKRTRVAVSWSDRCILKNMKFIRSLQIAQNLFHYCKEIKTDKDAHLHVTIAKIIVLQHRHRHRHWHRQPQKQQHLLWFDFHNLNCGRSICWRCTRLAIIRFTPLISRFTNFIYLA